MSRVSESTSEVLPFWKHPDLHPSPRVHSLLNGVFQTSWGHLAPGLQRSLRSAIQQLMQAGPAEGRDQGLSEAGARLIADRGRSCAEELRQRLQHDLLALAAGPSGVRPASLGALAADAQPRQEDSWQQDEQLQVTQMCARAEAQAGIKLSSLAWRLAAIQGGVPADTEQVVLGPHWLAECIDTVFGKLVPVPRHRMLLLNCLDQELYSAVPRMIEAVDQYLSDHRILPRIDEFLSSDEAKTAFARSTRRLAPEPQPSDIERHDGANSAPQTTQFEAAPKARGEASPTAFMPDVEQASTTNVRNGPAARALRELTSRQERSELLAFADKPRGQQLTAVPRAVARIWELLGRRRSSPTPGGLETHRPTASSRDVIAALNTLQHRRTRHHPSRTLGDGARESDLRRELLNELRRQSTHEAPRLADADANVIELVGRLFDGLLEDWMPTSRVHALLERMEAPIAKAALRDKSFFIAPEQPARAFLNAVASACEDWIEDEEQDQIVVERVESTIDQFCQSYDQDPGSFDLALDELERHLGALRKRAELAIRRQVDALRGREKLELARMAAREIVSDILDRMQPHQLIDGFLRNTWTDAITLAILRSGIDSKDAIERTDVAILLATALRGPRLTPETSISVADKEAPIREGLTATGLHDDVVQAVVNELQALALGQGEANASGYPHLADIARGRQRLGGGSDAEIAKGATNRESPVPGEPDSQQGSRCSECRVGQWLQRENRGGKRRRRLVAWRSQVNDRVLLVDIRGIRAEITALSDIARTSAGHVASGDVPSPVDRALQKVFADHPHA